MAFLIGMIVALGCMLGGFSAMGGHIAVIFQPYEFIIILGVSLGTFIIANSLTTIKDTGGAIVEAVLGRGPTQRDYLDVLGVLYTLMRELRGKARSEVEQHVDNPNESTIFKNFPKVLADLELTSFICDYCRLIIIGNARTHEIEALMDEEIQTVSVFVILRACSEGAKRSSMSRLFLPDDEGVGQPFRRILIRRIEVGVKISARSRIRAPCSDRS